MTARQDRDRIDRAERHARAAARYLRDVECIDAGVRTHIRATLLGTADALRHELEHAPRPAKGKTPGRPWRLWCSLGGVGALTLHGTYATEEAAQEAARRWKRDHGGIAKVAHRDDDAA